MEKENLTGESPKKRQELIKRKLNKDTDGIKADKNFKSGSKDIGKD